MATTDIKKTDINGTLKVGDIMFRGTNDLNTPYQILTSSHKGLEFIVGDRDGSDSTTSGLGSTYKKYTYMQVIGEPYGSSSNEYKVGINYNADVVAVNGYAMMTGESLIHDVQSAIVYVMNGYPSNLLSKDDAWKSFDEDALSNYLNS